MRSGSGSTCREWNIVLNRRGRGKLTCARFRKNASHAARLGNKKPHPKPVEVQYWWRRRHAHFELNILILISFSFRNFSRYPRIYPHFSRARGVVPVSAIYRINLLETRKPLKTSMMFHLSTLIQNQKFD